MYLMASNKYECDICGHQEKWDAHDDHRGDIWECEKCGKHFCTVCFVAKMGEEEWRKMLTETDNVFCPDCVQDEKQVKEFCINIKETLEMQVTIEADTIEEALEIVEDQWKDGCYILDADYFTGVEFSEVSE